MPPEPDRARRAFEGRMVKVVVEQWGDSEREIVERVDSVAIVAVDAEGRVVLVRQLREAARRQLVELPAGTVGEGEDPLGTAKRELAEETGLHGGRWRAGPVFFTTPGFCRERCHLFFADRLEEGEATPSEGEQLEVARWTREEVTERLTSLEDSKTLVGLLLHASR
jgi:8-oxo-dGTP pyrophosphatase MutT (NUDIX family)